MANQKLTVHLSSEQRQELEKLARSSTGGVAKVRRARVLLLADEDHLDGRRPDQYIAEAVGLSERQVIRIRRRFVREGEQAVERKPRKDAGVPKVLDGKAEAQLVTLCCSAPPPAVHVCCTQRGQNAACSRDMCCATVCVRRCRNSGISSRSSRAISRAPAASGSSATDTRWPTSAGR